MNIKFYNKLITFLSAIAFCRDFTLLLVKTIFNKSAEWNNFNKWIFAGVGIPVLTYFLICKHSYSYAAEILEPVQACVVARDVDLTDAIRAKFSQCLGWKSDQSTPLCLGSYQPINVTPLASPDEVRILADNVSFYREKRSTLTGHVEVQQTQRIVNAQTAYVYVDSKTNKVNKIEFLGDVRYLEPGKLMIARKAVINPQDNSGQVEDVLYRFNSDRKKAVLPAWGRASVIRRFANQDYFLKLATYSTCAPQDKAWDIQAKSITLNNAKATGVARNAIIRVHEVPVLYTPYLSFPTNKDRKSGFLMPLVGYSNVGGFDLGLPYYWNIAPDQDLTLVPHLYTERGVMMGGEYRFLTPGSTGKIKGDFLPDDRAYKNFLANSEFEFPKLQGNSTNRWSYSILENTFFTPDLQLHIDVQQVSDDYYLQDFSSNLALITQRQLLRQADLTYSTENWVFRGMGQSYQTLHPVNETPISPVYERLPQLMAQGYYYDLPFNANLNILGQYDQFHWPIDTWELPTGMPQGPRFHFNPVLSVPFMKPWGYVTPSVQVVENYYQVQNNGGFQSNYWGLQGNVWEPQTNWLSQRNFYGPKSVSFNRTIPRYSVDSGLFFERNFSFRGEGYRQTLEPRLFYLNVPYHTQTPIPVYDSGFMIFNTDQLFRTNRFSGFDRIGDANQLAYAVTTRWLIDDTGAERANFTIGQLRYFSDRKVQLCQSPLGYCYDDPNAFGNLSSTYDVSPIASRASYNLTPRWGITGDYVWDPATKATNNADLNLHYQPAMNSIINFGYSYLINGDVTEVRANGASNNALHQALIAFSWPVTERWSTVGAYNHNISKDYSMMSLLGVQYDSCCWAVRLLGGRAFQNLNASFEPQYNRNVYLQILLKGLGSVANGDPYNILTTYIPGYSDPFRY